MPAIKTRDVVKGTVKVIDKSAVAAERMKDAYVRTKDKAEHGIFAAEGDEIINRKEERQKIKKKSKVGKAHGTAPVKKCCGRGASA